MKSLTVKINEDDSNIYLDYVLNTDRWTLIYSKEKDKCILLHNAKPAQLKRLTPVQESAYKEVLEYAIIYHHEKGDAQTH